MMQTKRGVLTKAVSPVDGAEAAASEDLVDVEQDLLDVLPNSALVRTFRREMPTWSPLRVTVIRYRCAGACGADSRIGVVCQAASSGAVHENVSAAITRSESGSGVHVDIADTLRTRWPPI